MKVIELNSRTPPLAKLVRASKKGAILLVLDGKPQAVIERMNKVDMETWKYEHSPEAIAIGNKAREDYRKGRFVTAEDLRKELDGKGRAGPRK